MEFLDSGGVKFQENWIVLAKAAIFDPLFSSFWILLIGAVISKMRPEVPFLN